MMNSSLFETIDSRLDIFSKSHLIWTDIRENYMTSCFLIFIVSIHLLKIYLIRTIQKLQNMEHIHGNHSIFQINQRNHRKSSSIPWVTFDNRDIIIFRVNDEIKSENSLIPLLVHIIPYFSRHFLCFLINTIRILQKGPIMTTKKTVSLQGIDDLGNIYNLHLYIGCECAICGRTSRNTRTYSSNESGHIQRMNLCFPVCFFSDLVLKSHILPSIFNKKSSESSSDQYIRKLHNKMTRIFLRKIFIGLRHEKLIGYIFSWYRLHSDIMEHFSKYFFVLIFISDMTRVSDDMISFFSSK